MLNFKRDERVVELAVPLFPSTKLLDIYVNFLIFTTMIRSMYHVSFGGTATVKPQKAPIILPQG